MKTCTKCGVEKPFDEFNLQKRGKDGRSSWCKECFAAYKSNKYATDPVYVQRHRDLQEAYRRGEKLKPLPRKVRDIDERFDEKWEEDENGCWVWQAHTGKNGYGKFRVGNEMVLAHRWSYARAYGPISDDNELHHECGVRPCVNPEHLVEVTEEAHRELHAKRPA